MPVLELEPSVSPDDLFTFGHFAGHPTSRWWVLHTRPRAEKNLARHLWGRKVSFYLPLRKQAVKSAKGRRSSHLPVFPSYVFLFGDDEARLTALKTNQVIHCLHVDDQELMGADLARVHQLIQSNLPLSTVDEMIPGTEVDIISGPLAGYRGTVIRHNGTAKLLAEVHYFQRAVLAEVDESMIQPVWSGG